MKRLLIILFLLFPHSSFAEAPRVVASIYPIYSLAYDLMERVGTPELLTPASRSPHHLTLKPSERTALGNAELIVFISPDYETYLRKPLETLEGVSILALLDQLPEEQTLSYGHTHHHDHDHGHSDDHSDSAVDPHIWLNVANAKSMAQTIANQLIALDGEHRPTYEANLTSLLASLDALDQSLSDTLASAHDTPYIVFHDAYHYFTDVYGLPDALAISENALHTASVKHMAELREQAQAKGIECVFSEPQFSPAMSERLAEAIGGRVVILDPLGSTLPLGQKRGYETLMRALGDAFASCHHE